LKYGNIYLLRSTNSQYNCAQLTTTESNRILRTVNPLA
jgi:hypothetical protein